jgi:hypothetical protein
MAIQTWGGARSCYRFRDYGPHSAQTEQSGATALLTSPSQRTPQFYFVARPNVGRGKLAHLDLISDVLPFGRLWYGESNANRECNRLREARFAPLCWNRRDEANSRLRAHYLCSLTSIRFRYSLTSAKQHKQERQYQRDYKRTLYNCLK